MKYPMAGDVGIVVHGRMKTVVMISGAFLDPRIIVLKKVLHPLRK